MGWVDLDTRDGWLQEKLGFSGGHNTGLFIHPPHFCQATGLIQGGQGSSMGSKASIGCLTWDGWLSRRPSVGAFQTLELKSSGLENVPYEIGKRQVRSWTWYEGDLQGV